MKKDPVLLILVVGFILATLLTFVSASFPFLHGETLGYQLLILGWIVTLYQRCALKPARGLLIAIGLCLLLLQVLKVCRYFIFGDLSDTVSRYLWYAYYVPLVVSPMLTFFLAISIGKTRSRIKRQQTYLWSAMSLLALILIGLILSNDLHQLAFKGTTASYIHGPVYYAILLWNIVLLVLSFSTLIYSCRITIPSARRFLPPILLAVYPIYGFLYYLNGFRAFTVLGYTFFHFMDVYSFVLISYLESCIHIGLIPVNTRYPELFALCSLEAKLIPGQEKQIEPTSAESPRRVQTHPIPGGHVRWEEDLSHVRALRDTLEEVNEAISEENLLLQRENDLLQEQTSLKTRNRLYDEMLSSLGPELGQIDGLVDPDLPEGIFRRRLKEACIRMAYVKRRANLFLLKEQSSDIPLQELYLSIRESLQYVELYGIHCELRFDEAKSVSGGNEHVLIPAALQPDQVTSRIPADQLIEAFDDYERQLEQDLSSLHFLKVEIGPETPLVRMGGDAA